MTKILSCFVLPDTKRLDLGDDLWVEVKETLTYGEEQRLASISLTTVNFAANREEGETEIGLDMQRHAIERLVTWVVDWNFSDHTGKTVPVSRTAIQNLHPAIAKRLTDALDAHVAEVERGKLTPSAES